MLRRLNKRKVDMALTELQKSSRLGGIGASECGAILGVDPYQSAYDIWLKKTGKVDAEGDSEPAFIGNEIEGTIGRLAEHELGRRVVRPTSTFKHPNEVMLANIDFMLDQAKRGAEIVEAKSTGIMDGWGEPGTDMVPERVLVQVTAQMMCAGSNVAHVARLLGRFGFSFDMYVVRLNESLAASIEESVCDFWHNCVQKDIPPDDSIPALEIVKAVRRTEGKSTVVKPELVSAYLQANEASKAAEKLCDDAKAALMAAMGDAQLGVSEAGVVKISTVNTDRFDAKAFGEKHPELKRQFMVASSYPRLTVSKSKEKKA